MINSGNFAGPDDNGGRREHGVNSQAEMIARAREQAGDTYEEEEETTGPSGGMGRRAFIIGAGVLGIGAIAGGWLLFGPKPKEEPKEEPKKEPAEPVVEEPKLPTRLACTGEPLTAGRDVDPGAWYIERFNPEADIWLRIRREEQEWVLQKPQDKNNQLFWANQIVLAHLAEGDRIWANAVITKSGDYNIPRADTAQLSDIRAGSLMVGTDIKAGTYEVTAKKVEDEINPETHLAMEGDLTWSGRIAGLVSEWHQEKVAKLKEGQEAPSILEKCVGVITLDAETAEKKLGPMIGASTEFPAETAAAKAAAAATANPQETPPENPEGGEKSEEEKAKEEEAKKKAEEEAKKAEDAASTTGSESTETKNQDFSTALRDLLFSYFDGEETTGFIHVRDVDEITLETGQVTLPVMCSMILVEPLDDNDANATGQSSSSTTSSGSEQNSKNSQAQQESAVPLKADA